MRRRGGGRIHGDERTEGRSRRGRFIRDTPCGARGNRQPTGAVFTTGLILVMISVGPVARLAVDGRVLMPMRVNVPAVVVDVNVEPGRIGTRGIHQTRPRRYGTENDRDTGD